MNSVVVSAKTVDEAITNALLQLGASSDQVDIEVLEEGSKGFLGMLRRDAKIRATLKEGADPVLEASEPLGSEGLPAAVLCRCGQLGGRQFFLQYLPGPFVAKAEVEGCAGERKGQNHQQPKHFISGLAQADGNIEHHQKGKVGQRKGDHPRPGRQPGEQQPKPYQL